MNLIYACVFYQKEYINLLKLLINSIFNKSDINIKTTDILIITSPQFHLLIQNELKIFNLPIKYYILNYYTLFDAGCARLNIFNYELINNYENILYLDTDILLNSDVNILFNLDISSEKIYALEEGNIHSDFWGGQFFNFNEIDKNMSAFTSGILYFKNSETIKILFNTIKTHIYEYINVQKNNIPTCLDQPFIVYHAIIENKYDNQLLKKYAENNPSFVSPEKIIYHFPGGPGAYQSKNEKMTIFWNKMHEFRFITLTNTGYIKYTLNCLRSLERIQLSPKLLHIYVIGKDGYNILKQNEYDCTLINDNKNSNFHEFNTENFADITFYKFNVIYENLLKYNYVCFTDGDIVFENKNFIDYLKNNIKNYDMLVQKEGDDIDDFCSGFMFIKSNKKMLELFNPKNVILHKNKNKNNWNDQVYLNKMRKKNEFSYYKLPLNLFPNGKYYYSNKNLKPFLIHFNWVIGNEKEKKMKIYGKWYDKVKICQYGTDGFGHQLEGMIRLISLSLNNKAEYMYDLRKKFTFEHSNYDINNLNSYLIKALCILSNNNNNNNKKSLNEKNYNIIQNEKRTFTDIIKNDNYEKNIYYYDGVGCGTVFPSNFEEIDDLEKSLPKLRDAFVLQNEFLPQPSYNNEKKNIVCHIRLGDAIGKRILDNNSIYECIKLLQKNNDHNIIIHSDGDVNFLKTNNTIIFNKKIDVLQILSDFINADILIINYSSLSIAAHLLADEKQKVLCPNIAGLTFYRRILKKCKKISGCSDTILLNKQYTWQNHTIQFLDDGKMNAFGSGIYKKINTHKVQADFGGRVHILTFNNDYTSFVSIREGDGEKVIGELL